MTSLIGFARYLWAKCGRKPARIYYCNGGIGDELMLTAVAAAARAAGHPLDLIVAYPEIWRGNPDPASLHTGVARWHYASMRGWIQTEIVHLQAKNDHPLHLAEQMAARAGVILPPNWRPKFPASAAITRDPLLIVLQNSCRGALYSASTKEWPQDRWIELTQRLAGEFRLVQIGTPADPPLPLAEDLRGRTTLAEAARLLSNASLFLGLESGLQHLAAAVRTPSVIIFGGRTHPHVTGYASNANLTRSPSCAGCGLNTGCLHHMICMDIPVLEVETAVRRMLATGVP